jgi:hypothetical protein
MNYNKRCFLMLDLEKKGEGIFKAVFHNGVEVGEFIILEDGYYAFFPNLSRGGAWDEYLLKMISDTLKDLNKDWEAKLKEYFDGQRL